MAVSAGYIQRAESAPGAMRGHNIALDAARVLAHELAGLIDAAGRSARLADGCLERIACGDDAESQRETARLHLHRASTALDFAATALRTALHAADIGTLRPAAGSGAVLHEVITQAAQLHSPLARERHIELHIDIDAAAAKHPASPLFNVVSNALRNAVQHARAPGGRVALRAFMRKERLVIEITNDGTPPSEESIARAFEPGFSTTGGAGLGLAVSRRIVEQQGGSVSLAQGDGQRGAKFRAELPHPAPAAPPALTVEAWTLNEWGE